MSEENTAGITPERLRALLAYDPETGHFTWRVPLSRRIRPGDRAGYANDGYLLVRIDRRNYRGHRLAWLYTFGEWPNGDLDHINCDRADNRISNLREATRSQNQANMRRPRHNTSGFKGASFHQRKGKWQAIIQKDGKTLYLGLFPTAADAHAAYCAAAQELHGEFWRAA